MKKNIDKEKKSSYENIDKAYDKFKVDLKRIFHDEGNEKEDASHKSTFKKIYISELNKISISKNKNYNNLVKLLIRNIQINNDAVIELEAKLSNYKNSITKLKILNVNLQETEKKIEIINKNIQRITQDNLVENELLKNLKEIVKDNKLSGDK